MGSEHSQLAGLDIDEKAVEVTHFWAHHAAYIDSEHSTNISIFIGEPVISGTLWLSQTPLEKAAKNLMIYRHPSILKYISSWRRGSKYYLAVEDVKPLTHVLAQQNTLQICIGLFSILKALIFLHEKGCVSHNNVATAAIYVTKDGSWRLGGTEYLCSYAELNSDYLNKIRTHRYSKSIDPDEERNIKNREIALEFIDVYGFGVLVLEVLKKKSDDILLSISNFTDLCKQQLLHSNAKSRPKLRSLLEHPFFNHEFIAIHSFLIELPLKSEAESMIFFSSLVANLQMFDENIVASQLGSLLLSRMVLLNKTANTNVIPYLFTIKEEPSCTKGLFTEATFKQNIVPILLAVFCVRDAQIRLILLEYFSTYIHCFSREELQADILPELLVGIKDCNDHLVSVTLRALADLVPILGAAAVIGGKRARLFNDGRPAQLRQSHGNEDGGRHSVGSRRGRTSSSRRSSGGNQNSASGSSSGNARHSSISNTIQPTLDQSSPGETVNSSFTNLDTLLPERPSPDGEEDETTETDELEPPTFAGPSTNHNDDDLEEEENWDDWGNTDDNLSTQQAHTVDTLSLNNYVDFSEDVSDADIATSANTNLRKSVSKRDIDDIFALDIKLQGAATAAGSSAAGDIDFFQDMEPVIETAAKFVINPLTNSSSSRLEVNMHQNGAGDQDGWDVNAHRPGALKQTNKTHKHGRHRSKGAISIAAKGKVNVKAISRKSKADMTREQRRNQTLQLRKNKRADALEKLRSVGGNAPLSICILPLNECIDRNTALSIITQCDPEAEVFVNNKLCTSINMPRFKNRFTVITPSIDNDFDMLDALKMCDVAMFIVSAVGGTAFGTDIVDEFGKKLLQEALAQGLPTPVIAVTDLESIAPKKKNEHKQIIQKLMTKWFPEEKIQPLDSNADALNLMRHIFNKKRKVLKHRERRPYLISEDVKFVPDATDSSNGTLLISGYLKGSPLSANQLVYLAGLGTYQLSEISVATSSRDAGSAASVSFQTLHEAEPGKQESLQMENIPDPLDAEQTWPTEEELKMAEGNKIRKVKRVPKGWSDYQAAWIPDEDAISEEDNQSDSDEEEDMDDQFMDALSEAEDEEDSQAGDDDEYDDSMSVTDSQFAANDERYDATMDETEERKALEMVKAAKEDQMFPDEVDTPAGENARDRFIKFRGLESFRTSPWDTKEDLPIDYARIFQFANFDRTRKRILNDQLSELNMAQPGTFIRLHITSVPQKAFSTYQSVQGERIYATGLLPHEQKMSVHNVVLHRLQHSAYGAPIKSKELLVFQCGYRRFIVRPVFSQHTNGSKHKFERYFQPDSTVVATFYAPIQFPPAPVLCYRPLPNGKLDLIATGSLLSCNPDRIVLKRAVLSGHPLKVLKRSAVVRFMFFNRDDIAYFKPCKLRTKLGRIGHIKEPLGTHGHMKCIFDGQLKSHDTVLLNLYKRVFPKWSYEELIATEKDTEEIELNRKELQGKTAAMDT